MLKEEIKIIKTEIEEIEELEEEIEEETGYKAFKNFNYTIDENFEKLLNKFLKAKQKFKNITLEEDEEAENQNILVKFESFNHQGDLKIEFNQKLKDLSKLITNERNLESIELSQIALAIFDFKIIREGKEMNPELID